jgi:hypothetical protein
MDEATQITKRARIVGCLERLELDEALQLISPPDGSDRNRPSNCAMLQHLYYVAACLAGEARPTGLREYNALMSICLFAPSTAQRTATERMKVILASA